MLNVFRAFTAVNFLSVQNANLTTRFALQQNKENNMREAKKIKLSALSNNWIKFMRESNHYFSDYAVQKQRKTLMVEKR
jgi:hypothetical protein